MPKNEFGSGNVQQMQEGLTGQKPVWSPWKYNQPQRQPAAPSIGGKDDPYKNFFGPPVGRGFQPQPQPPRNANPGAPGVPGGVGIPGGVPVGSGPGVGPIPPPPTYIPGSPGPAPQPPTYIPGSPANPQGPIPGFPPPHVQPPANPGNPGQPPMPTDPFGPIGGQPKTSKQPPIRTEPAPERGVKMIAPPSYGSPFPPGKVVAPPSYGAGTDPRQVNVNGEEYLRRLNSQLPDMKGGVSDSDRSAAMDDYTRRLNTDASAADMRRPDPRLEAAIDQYRQTGDFNTLLNAMLQYQTGPR